MNGKYPPGPFSRRSFLRAAGGGAGWLAALSLLAKDHLTGPAVLAAGRSSQTSATHFPPRAKRVIWLFMHGGPSHVDLLDPKPDLIKYAGQPLPESLGPVMTRRDVAKNPLLGPVRPFRKRGSSGLEISDFLPSVARHADDLFVIRSLHGDSVNHPQSVYQMNTGRILMGHPSVGSWVAYGLGSENQNVPAFVVLPDPGGGIKGGPPAWGSGYLPAVHQGVPMRSGPKPILFLSPPDDVSLSRQHRALELSNQFNREFTQSRGNDDELLARLASYEMAFRMQAEAPRLVDISAETVETHRMYGIDQPATREFGQRCLLARRMVEQGVRFVQVYSGDTNGWDAHTDVIKNHEQMCGATDLPIAGLLSDLKQRGLLDDTLVIWGGEFGRMPMSEKGTGRDHNPWGYSMWLAGAHIRGGRSYGATDPVGLRAADDKVHVNDFHATILRLLGIDSNQLSYLHNGLEERLVGPTGARVINEVLA